MFLSFVSARKIKIEPVGGFVIRPREGKEIGDLVRVNAPRNAAPQNAAPRDRRGGALRCLSESEKGRIYAVY